MTVVVKLSYDVQRDGVARLAARPDPITNDTQDGSGLLLFPSDFVRRKARCDVLIVGRALTQPVAPTWLEAPGIRKLTGHVGALGPVAGRPDVTDHQYAAPDQQVDHPALPIDIVFRRQAVAVPQEVQQQLQVHIAGPTPQLGIARSGTIERENLLLDTLSIDPARGRIVITMRAVVDDLDERDAPMLVVDDRGALPSDTREIVAWPVISVAPSSPVVAPSSPAILERTPARTVPITERPGPASSAPSSPYPLPLRTVARTAQMSARSFGAALPFAKPAPAKPAPAKPADDPMARPERPAFPRHAPDVESTQTQIEIAPVSSRALPFIQRPEGSGATRVEERTETDLAPVGRETLIDPATHGAPALPFAAQARFVPPRPVAMAPISSADLPFRVPGAPSPQRPTPPVTTTAAPVPEARFSVGFDLKPIATPAHAAPSLAIPTLPLETFLSLRARLWSAPEKRRALLREHGLTDLKWRLVERTFVDRTFVDQVGEDKASGVSARSLVVSLRAEVGQP